MSEKRYTASDVKAIVGMDRNMLFYCVKTLGLITPAQAKARVTLYDLENLLDLALIQQLLSLGINQAAIGIILREPVTFQSKQKVHTDPPEQLPRIWDEFATYRKVYEGEGCTLVLRKGAAARDAMLLTIRQAMRYLGSFGLLSDEPNDPRNRFPPFKAIEENWGFLGPGHFGHILIVDILGLVQDIESGTGESLSKVRMTNGS